MSLLTWAHPPVCDDRFYQELVYYVVFLVLLMAVIFSMPVHFQHEQTTAFHDLYFRMCAPRQCETAAAAVRSPCIIATNCPPHNPR